MTTFGVHRVITDHIDVLRSLYTQLSSTVNAQSVARNMFQSNALTVKELQAIQSKHYEPIKAAKQLLNIVICQSDKVYSCFLDALKKTGHLPVFEVIVSASYKGKYYNFNRGICRIVHHEIAICISS